MYLNRKSISDLLKHLCGLYSQRDKYSCSGSIEVIPLHGSKEFLIPHCLGILDQLIACFEVKQSRSGGPSLIMKVVEKVNGLFSGAVES